jgi:hypothetical protein
VGAFAVAFVSRFSFSCHPDKGAAAFAAPTRDLSPIVTAPSVTNNRCLVGCGFSRTKKTPFLVFPFARPSRASLA